MKYDATRATFNISPEDNTTEKTPDRQARGHFSANRLLPEDE